MFSYRKTLTVLIHDAEVLQSFNETVPLKFLGLAVQLFVAIYFLQGVFYVFS